MTFNAFAEAVLERRMASCMGARGLPAPPPIPDSAPDNVDFPDLRAIASSGAFGAIVIPTPPSPTRGLTAHQRRVYEAAERTCATLARRVFAQLDAETEPLASQWQAQLAVITRLRPVQRTIAHFDRCADGAGVAGVNGPLGFLSRVDAATLALRTGSKQQIATTRRFAYIFVQCMTPEERTIDRLRARAWTRFSTRHKSELSRLRAAATAVLAQVQRREGVRLHDIALYPAPKAR